MAKGYIPKGMVIKGNVESDGDLVLEGEIIGNVSIEGALELKGNVCGKKLKVGSVELSDGIIESDIECIDYIGVGRNVTIFGDVKADKADINGAIFGNVDVKNEVTIGSTAVLKGDLVANDLSVELGAICDVNLERSYRETKASDFFDKYMKEHNIKEKTPVKKEKKAKAE